MSGDDASHKEELMAKTEGGNGKKKVYVRPHTKKVGGKTVKVPPHYRSTPN